jgi:hypothetical protein
MARSSSGFKDDQFFDWETSVRIAYGLLTSRVRETVTRLAHNQKIVGSTPTPATNKNLARSSSGFPNKEKQKVGNDLMFRTYHYSVI